MAPKALKLLTDYYPKTKGGSLEPLASLSLPRGGTEITAQEFFSRVSPKLVSRVHVSLAALPTYERHLKPHVLWTQQSYDQPVVQNLRNPEIVSCVDHFVFASEWQRRGFLKRFPIDPERSSTIHNAVIPLPPHTKKKGITRLIYTSTPFRGLDVLLDAFELSGREDVELHIYSGMSLYARPEEDARFAHLYDRARRMKGVFFHGVVPNEEVRKALTQAHIFAYPSTWEETSCLSLIEAMSAGCLAVISDLGALPETASGFAQLYPYIPERHVHAERFAKELNRAIDSFWSEEVQQVLKKQKRFFDKEYSWDTRIKEWEALLEGVVRRV